MVAADGLLDEVDEDIVNDAFDVGKEAIDRVSRRRSIKAMAQPDDGVPKLSFSGTDAIDLFVVAVEKVTRELW